MKTIVLAIISLISFTLFSQESEDWKKPTVWFEKDMAMKAKEYIKKERFITYCRCSTGEITYSLEKPTVKVKPSTKGEPYYDVFVIGEDQSGEKKTRKIFLDDIWVRNEDGSYRNMAEDLGLERKCSVPEVNEYFD